jgi:hypothetical protein
VNAGSSAAAWAAEAGRLCWWQHIAVMVGVETPEMARKRRLAARRRAGAEGERRTALLAEPLGREGWYGLYDRIIPGLGRANLDHLWITPCGRAIGGDSKLWSARPDRGGGEVRLESGRLVCGTQDKDGQVDTARKETDTVARLLGVPVVSLIVVHNAPVAGGGFRVRGVHVLSADRLLDVLRSATGGPDPVRARRLAELAAARLPSYVQ